MVAARDGFRIFDHTADIGLEIWADTIENLFAEAGRGLFSLMADLGQVGQVEVLPVDLHAENIADLFLVWLKELVYLFDTKRILFSRFQILELKDGHLRANVLGEKLNAAKHKLGREVKAVTHHLFELKQEANGFRARVILDI
jgi:SHS2 domain-containing protein